MTHATDKEWMHVDESSDEAVWMEGWAVRMRSVWMQVDDDDDAAAVDFSIHCFC